MIKDLVFVIDKSTSMCRKIRDVEKIIEQKILNLHKKGTNRITVIEIDDSWNFILRQVESQEFKYQFKPYYMTQPVLGCNFIDCAYPALLEFQKDLSDSDDVSVIFLVDGFYSSKELAPIDIENLCKENKWKYESLIHNIFGISINNPWITTTGTIMPITGGNVPWVTYSHGVCVSEISENFYNANTFKSKT